jgi:hypothetical protein
MCLTLRVLGSSLIRPFFVRIVRNQHQLERKILNLENPLSCIGADNGRSYPIEEGPPLKPSSPKLAMYVEAKIVLRLVHRRTPFQKLMFSKTCVTFPMSLTNLQGWVESKDHQKDQGNLGP